MATSCYCVHFLLIFILSVSSAEVMNENFSVSWTIYKDSITFRIVAKTLGWVAIGFNKVPQMKGGDFMLAGVAKDKPYLYDLHDPTGHVRPIVDKHQDYKMIWGQESDARTYITVKRTIKTNDPDDRAFTDQPVYMLWAYNEHDANSSTAFTYHGPNKGAKKVTLLKPEYELKFGPKMNH